MLWQWTWMVLLAGGCQQEWQQSTATKPAGPVVASAHETSSPAITDDDETVSGIINAPAAVVGTAIETAVTQLKIVYKEPLHKTELDGRAVVNTAVGNEVYIEYATAGEGKTQLKVYRNPRTMGQKADDTVKSIFHEIAAAATRKRN